MEILSKWRMILGGNQADGTQQSLSDDEQNMDDALSALYDFEEKKNFDYQNGGAGEKGKKGGQGGSSPNIARWLGDIRTYFPQSVVKVMQADAMAHPVLQKKMLLEPDILEQTTPDVHLVATLMELGKMIPSKTKDTARRVVQKVVDELLQKLEQRTIQALTGAINRNVRNTRPRLREMNWDATIRKNLKYYQADLKTIIPETRIGYGRKTRRAVKDIVLCLDQSGSMGTSVVYSGIFGFVMASLPTVQTKMVVFDTEVADLTENLTDPVDLLFGVQLGGGTDINRALQYCQDLVTKPNDTILILISDLYEGGDLKQMRRRCANLVQSGVQFIVLLALNDDGAPSYDHQNAQFLHQLGVPVFACSPDLFPEMMAAAIGQQDLAQWAAQHEIVLKG